MKPKVFLELTDEQIDAIEPLAKELIDSKQIGIIFGQFIPDGRIALGVIYNEQAAAMINIVSPNSPITIIKKKMGKLHLRKRIK